MNSRERMKRFLNGESVDRIPCGLGGCETAGLHNVAYDRLKTILGENSVSNRMGTFMNNAVFDVEVLEAMGSDVVLAGSRMNPSRFFGPGHEAGWKPLDIWDITIQVPQDWTFHKDPDGTWWWGENTKCPPGSYYFDPVPRPQSDAPAQAPEPPSPDDYNPSHELDPNYLSRLTESVRWLYENTTLSVACGESIQSLQLEPGGMEQWYMRMVTDPHECAAFLDKAVEAGLAQLRQLNQAVGQYCDTLHIAHDMGDSRGVCIGPELWRKIYKPAYKKFFAGWHEITDMKCSLHCCGAISEIIGDLIECGVDMLNPVQISAADMNPATLKERFGNDIIFYGGVYDAIDFMSFKNAQDVYDGVRANIQALSKGGSYLFAGVHNLPGDLQEDHLRAMLDAYHDCQALPACL
ncbi:MAG: uroporphyrinogen decarboxylase family protein [Planctomycetota bacterium]|jgi:uroporphyrinogen decarboxylase